MKKSQSDTESLHYWSQERHFENNSSLYRPQSKIQAKNESGHQARKKLLDERFARERYLFRYYMKMTRRELYALARQFNIRGRSLLSKKGLAKRLARS